MTSAIISSSTSNRTSTSIAIDIDIGSAPFGFKMMGWCVLWDVPHCFLEWKQQWWVNQP